MLGLPQIFAKLLMYQTGKLGCARKLSQTSSKSHDPSSFDDRIAPAPIVLIVAEHSNSKIFVYHSVYSQQMMINRPLTVAERSFIDGSSITSARLPVDV